MLLLGKMERVCNFYLSVAARKFVWADPSLKYTSCCWDAKQPTNKQTNVGYRSVVMDNLVCNIGQTFSVSVFAQDGIVTLGKAHTCSTPVCQQSLQGCLRNCADVLKQVFRTSADTSSEIAELKREKGEEGGGGGDRERGRRGGREGRRERELPFLLLVGWLPTICAICASVSPRQTCLDYGTRCHSEIQVAVQLAISPICSILTPDQPLPALTL